MNQVTTKTEKAVAVHSAPPVVSPHIGADELIISKILPVQAMSDKAKDRNNPAELGEFRDTVENKLFGDDKTPVEFIPIHMVSFWAIYDMTAGGQGKFVEQFPVDASNENLKKEEIVNGVKLKRVKTYECYVLIPSELLKGEDFPYVLSFRSSSARAGKTLITQLYVKNRHAGKQPWAVACELSCTEEENDNGSFYVQHTKPKRAATSEEMQSAEYWYKMITAGAVKKDDSDIVGGSVDMDSVDTTPF